MKTVPRLKVKMMSDYKWQLLCLKSRLHHPIRYARIGDNVVMNIIKTTVWLIRHHREKAEVTNHD